MNAAESSCTELAADDPSLGELGPRVVAVLERILSGDARGLRRLATADFRAGIGAELLQNELDRARATGQTISHLDGLRVWRLQHAPTNEGGWIDCGPQELGPKVQSNADALLAVGIGPREGTPGQSRLSLLLTGDSLSLDYLHIAPASMGSTTAEGFLQQGEGAAEAGKSALAHLLLGLAAELSESGPRVELAIKRRARAALAGVAHGLPTGIPQTWSVNDQPRRVYRIEPWPISPFEPGLVLEYETTAGGSEPDAAREADELAAALARRYPELAEAFRQVVFVPRSGVSGPELDPAQAILRPTTVRDIPWEDTSEAEQP